jgi:hypothetical protein
MLSKADVGQLKEVIPKKELAIINFNYQGGQLFGHIKQFFNTHNVSFSRYSNMMPYCLHFIQTGKRKVKQQLDSEQACMHTCLLCVPFT